MQKFVAHHAHNIERDVSIVDLCNTKKNKGELFSTFLQRRRHLSSRRSFHILEEQLVEIFISNLNEEMEFQLEVKCSYSFEEMIAQGLKFEKALIKKGLVKIYKDNKDSPQLTYNNNKPNFCSKRKNIINDGIVDARNIKISQPMVKIVRQANNRNNNNPKSNLNNPNNNIN